MRQEKLLWIAHNLSDKGRMRGVRINSRSLLFFLVLAGICGAVSAQGRGEAIPRFGIGPYFNAGIGSNGPGAVPGLTVLLDRFPVKVHIGYWDQVIDVVSSVDWLPLEFAFGNSGFSWHLGPGAYFGWTSSFGASPYRAFAAGMRAVVETRKVFFDSYEFYSGITPSYGIGILNGFRTSMWTIDVEVGLRYLLFQSNPHKSAVPAR